MLEWFCCVWQTIDEKHYKKHTLHLQERRIQTVIQRKLNYFFQKKNHWLDLRLTKLLSLAYCFMSELHLSLLCSNRIESCIDCWTLKPWFSVKQFFNKIKWKLNEKKIFTINHFFIINHIWWWFQKNIINIHYSRKKNKN